MLRAVVDVNVLVSALLSAKGAPGHVVRAWRDGAFELIVSSELVAELVRVAARPRLARRLDSRAVDLLAAQLRSGGISVEESPVRRIVGRDPRDDYLVVLARAGDAHVIVTGDAHLLDLEGLEPRAMTPRAFVELLDRIEKGAVSD